MVTRREGEAQLGATDEVGGSEIMGKEFTAEAEAAWALVPAWAKAKLITKVWCPHCRRATTMVDFVGRVERKDLVLSGRCTSCGGEVEGGWRR